MDKRLKKALTGERREKWKRMLLIAAVLSACFVQRVSAAYHHSGTALENSFSIMVVRDYRAELKLKFRAGNGKKTEIRWYEKQDKTERLCRQETVSAGAGDQLRETVLDVEISLADGTKRYRCELRNEAGIVLSESYLLRVSEDGASVLCERESYQADLSNAG